VQKGTAGEKNSTLGKRNLYTARQKGIGLSGMEGKRREKQKEALSTS
jgi:hypothetical protein